jgi:hypothetical protein
VLTGVGLSVVAHFGHRGMLVRGSFGGCGSRLGFREERGNDWKLIDDEAGLDGGWMRRSSMRWPWKRWQVASASKLFGDCSPGDGSGSGWRLATRCGPAKRTARQRGTRWQLWWPLKSRASGGEREEEEKGLALTCSSI